MYIANKSKIVITCKGHRFHIFHRCSTFNMHNEFEKLEFTEILHCFKSIKSMPVMECEGSTT